MKTCHACHKHKPSKCYSKGHRVCHACRARMGRLRNAHARRDWFLKLVSWQPPGVV